MTESTTQTQERAAIELSRRIQVWPVERLKPYEKNARTHTKDQIAKVARSIQEFGFTNPILVDKDAGIIAGHARLAAATLLGMTQVPVIELTHLNEAQRRAYIIADNRLALDAGWDDALLIEEMKRLEGEGFDLLLTGFELDEMHALLADDTVEEVAAPAPPEHPTSRSGDIWVCGAHRVMCGNSASDDDVDRLLAGAPVHLVNTDPPYNVRVEPRSNNALASGLTSSRGVKHHQGFDIERAKKRNHGKGVTQKPGPKQMRAKDRQLDGDFITDEAFAHLLAAWFNNIGRVLLPGRTFYIWAGYSNIMNYPAPIKAAGLYFSQAIIWDKQHPVLIRKDFMGAHEWCFYGWREGAAHQWFGPMNVPDIWAVQKVSPQKMIHLTEKPIELAVRALHYSSRPGENVLDLFGGSGSTMMGAEETGRRAFSMEIDPAYCDVIVERWQAATGNAAVLEGAGKNFAAVKAERVGKKR